MIFLRGILILGMSLQLSCSNQKKTPSYNFTVMQLIAGRDEGISKEREELYCIRVPAYWKRLDPPRDESLQDTTKSLCEFYLNEGNESIRITLHNFPSQSSDDRIPPMAQISRWKRQFDVLDPSHQLILPQAFSGYAGFLYQGSGKIKGEDVMVMGWSLQIGPEHYRTLSKNFFPSQMRADVTIKASGPRNLVDRYRNDIMAFARSFELIKEIPQE
jgi:hypothetical protein